MGPSPVAPFNRRRFLTTYRLFSDYAGGYITDFGNHRIDSVHQIMSASEPHTISAVGRRLCPENAGDIYDLHLVTYQYPDFIMEYAACWVNSHGLGGRSAGMSYYGMRGAYNRPHGFAFYGTKAALFVDRVGYEIFPELEPGAPYEPPLPAKPISSIARNVRPSRAPTPPRCTRKISSSRCAPVIRARWTRWRGTRPRWFVI